MLSQTESYGAKIRPLSASVAGLWLNMVLHDSGCMFQFFLVRWHLCFYWLKPTLHFGCSQHFKHIFVFELDLLRNNSHTGFSCTASKADQRNTCAVWLGNKIPVFYQHCPLLSAATASLCFWMQNSNPTLKITGKNPQEETNHSLASVILSDFALQGNVCLLQKLKNCTWRVPTKEELDCYLLESQSGDIAPHQKCQLLLQ